MYRTGKQKKNGSCNEKRMVFVKIKNSVCKDKKWYL